MESAEAPWGGWRQYGGITGEVQKREVLVSGLQRSHGMSLKLRSSVRDEKKNTGMPGRQKVNEQVPFVPWAMSGY